VRLMRIVRVVAMAVVALVALPALAPAHESGWETFFENFGQTSTEDRRGPSLAALRESSSHNQVGGKPAYELANGCYALRSRLTDDSVVENGDGSYSASAEETADAEPFRLQATGLGKYLLYGEGRDFMAAQGGDVRVDDEPSGETVWEISQRKERGYTLYSRDADKVVAADPDNGDLALVDKDEVEGRAGRFSFQRTEDCEEYPEASLNATGKPFKGTRNGEVVGFVEAHQHLMFFEALGGEFHCGRPWHRFGVEFALPDCEDLEGPQGAAAPVQNHLNYGNPAALHDTVGWPTFEDWPKHHTLTFEQMYYRWLERAWMGGLRVYVALNTDNKALCDAYPRSRYNKDCNEMNSVRRQIANVYELQDYIDAQRGGPGKGWFRIVKSPGQARKVIEAGKLAVILGIETSQPLDCNVLAEVPTCDKDQIDVELNDVYDMGVRQMELLNKFDNAFGGVAGDAGSTGVAVNSANFKETGSFWRMDTCEGEAEDQPQVTGVPRSDIGAAFQPFIVAFGPFSTTPAPLYPPEPHCNQLPFSGLGKHMVERMSEKGMIIDPDHLGVIARDGALDLLEKRKYPGVISSHSWADVDSYPRIHEMGGLVTPYAGNAESFVESWRYNRKLSDRDKFAIGYGSDVNGLGSQGGPRNGSNPVDYPFQSAIGDVEFDRVVAGEQEYDINEDGVAHYGLYPDWIEDLRQIAGDQIVKDMSRGAEAYLDMWERAIKRGKDLHEL
jgi:microsomal dipeptidase-like Zn-dependent dipeptidase